MTYDSHRRTVLGAGLKAARKRSGLSAKKAASLLLQNGLKCTRGTLLAWERGGGFTSREPFASDLIVIASVYACSVEDFFSAQAVAEKPEEVAARPEEAILQFAS